MNPNQPLVLKYVFKTLSRGKKLNKESYIKFVKGLQISDASKNKLIKLTPKTYIGLSNKL